MPLSIISDTGKTFVHHPSCEGQSAIRSQVKLQFQSVTDQKCVVTRSLDVTLKKKPMRKGAKPKFDEDDDGVKGYNLALRTLESVLKIGDDSLSSKCADIDREMVNLLGVPKPIISNVIFCHQEESYWPLGE